MPCTVTGYLRALLPTAVPVPQVNKPVYAQPSRFAIFVNNGASWVAWTKNVTPPNTDSHYPDAIQCLTNSTGLYSFVLPYTDTEILSPGGTIEWQIHDPLTGQYYYGELPSSISSPVSIYELVASHGWGIGNGVIPTPSGNVVSGTLTFNSSSGQEQTVALSPPMPSASYTPSASPAWDDLGTTLYAAGVKAGWTASSFVVRISSPVPVGRTVLIPWSVIA